MRISDWSSDVCSSDLLVAMERTGIKVDPAILREMSADFAKRMVTLEAEIHALAGEPFNVGSPKQLGQIQIGRASCRERVCQDVSISVVAVSLKTKYNNKTVISVLHTATHKHQT